MFTSQVIQLNVFLALCLGIWWLHENWISEILKFGFKSFWSEIKNNFPSIKSALETMIPGKNVFRYYYDSALKVIKDFKRYKEDTSTNPTQTSMQQIENVSTMTK